MRMISRTTDKLLVKNVKEQPCIFKRYDVNFKNHRAKEVAWAEVAKACCAPAEYCKLRWVYLRSKYSRVIKLRAMGKRVNWPLDNEMKFLQKFIIQRGQRRSNQSPIDIEPIAYKTGEETIENDTEMINNGDDGPFQFEREIDPYEDAVSDLSADMEDTKMTMLQMSQSPQMDEMLNRLDTVVKEIIQQNTVKQMDVDDEDILFGRTIGCMIKRLDPVVKNMARVKIMNFVGNLQLGLPNTNITM